MPVNEHGVAVDTVPGNVGNIEFSIYDADPTANGTNDVEQYCVVDVLRLMPNFPIKLQWSRKPIIASRCNYLRSIALAELPCGVIDQFFPGLRPFQAQEL
jgi:hypothetical protein